MRKKRIFWGIVPAFILGTAIFFMNAAVADAKEQCNIIPFQGQNGLIKKTVEINAGDCVVWLNWTGSANNQKNSEILISFGEGEKCIDATVPSESFNLEPETGCFLSQSLGYGQTVSLVFNKAGTYKYKIKSSVGPEQSGQIVVK